MEIFSQIYHEVIDTVGGWAAMIIMLISASWFFVTRWYLQRDAERIKHDLSTLAEIQKAKLRKSEFLFEKEFEAASELVAFRRGMMPIHQFPEMDWHDACDKIAQNFDSIENELGSFLKKHGAATPDEVVDLISDCIGIAGQNKFEAIHESVSKEANKAAEQLYEKISESEEKFLEEIRSQAKIE